MRRTSTLASTLAALADATAALPGLTCGELRRVRVFAEGLRRERLGVGPATSDAVASAAPYLDAIAAMLAFVPHLDALLGVADRAADLRDDEGLSLSAESRANRRAVVDQTAHLLSALISLDADEARALALLFRATADGTPPS